mmetsp:Transcript_11183/g.20935  ORF Transcript_11183/g.20935 Transcript_11183/m.20935 type:complete len:144 (+) Transcript_11183:195-626(+)
MMNTTQHLKVLLLLLCAFEISGFSVTLKTSNCYSAPLLARRAISKSIRTPTKLSAGPETDDDATMTEKKKSLQEKMARWEASEEEIKAASLGGLTPGKRGTDGFDIGLYIAFPIIVATSLFFAVFPFIMDKIDVSSVGPPPTV